MLQIIFAVLAGILTIGAPCILPLLPILLGASVGQKSKTRPLFIAAGFVLMFALVGLSLSYIVQKLQISPDSLRNIAVFALAIFGSLLVWPKPFELLTMKLSGTINSASQLGQKAGNGNWGGFILGLILGVIWTPCAGPVLGSILTLIATQADLAKSSLLLTAYALGAGIPMLVIAYGGQLITSKVRFLSQYAGRLQQFFGALIMLLAVLMAFQYDLKIQAKLLEFYNFGGLEQKLIPSQNLPQASKNNTLEKNMFINLPNLGKAPDFTGIAQWLNSEPLSVTDLQDKVVLVDFWTYSCINCIRTLPYVTKWYDTYKDKNFVVIGIHTPEFEFEKVTDNVKTAIQRYNIHYPVAQDNNFSTWNNYKNQFWPAHYLIDKDGNIRYTHFGEGKYEETENNIRMLLNETGSRAETPQEQKNQAQSPEMYFGLSRLENLAPEQSPSRAETQYQLPEQLKLNNFALGGVWKFSEENLICVKDCILKLKYSAAKIFMVASSAENNLMEIYLDGKKHTNVEISNSSLYPLYESEKGGQHTIELKPQNGLQAFTFTFG